jgi:hypothetical protein
MEMAHFWPHEASFTQMPKFLLDDAGWSNLAWGKLWVRGSSWRGDFFRTLLAFSDPQIFRTDRTAADVLPQIVSTSVHTKPTGRASALDPTML